MSSNFLYGLLPDHLLVILLLALMVLETVRASPRVAGVLLKLTLIAACAALLHQHAAGYTVELIPGEVRIDSFAIVAKLVVAGCALLWAFLTPAVTYKTAFLLASSLLGTAVVMDSASFVTLFIGIEMLSLPAFALMVHGAGNTSASEGAFKYLLLSAVATALMLFGIALSYGITGTFALADFVAAARNGAPPALASAMLVLGGFLLKAAVFPFHGWAPDAYDGARMSVTALLASVVKGTVVLGLVRIFGDAALDPALTSIVATLAILSAFYGNIAGIRQQRLKRLIAYSSIAHAGYMAFALADTTGARVHDLLWYVGIYAVTVILACATFAMLASADDDDLRRVDGTFRSRPIAALVFGLAMLSLAGVPPLPGFFAKLFVFRSLVASDHLVGAVLAVVGSFVGVTYYLRLFFRLFTRPGDSGEVRTSRLGAT